MTVRNSSTIFRMAEGELTYAALSIHLHCVQNWIVTRGSGGCSILAACEYLVLNCRVVPWWRLLRADGTGELLSCGNNTVEGFIVE